MPLRRKGGGIDQQSELEKNQNIELMNVIREISGCINENQEEAEGDVQTL